MTQIRAQQADITALNVDAIVNAANTALLGGGGVDTVGPVWKGGGRGEAALLASCYPRSLQLAADHRLRSVAFPAISTGAYGYPLQAASEIALRTVKDFVYPMEGIDEVVFCCHTGEALATYERLLGSS